jgi:chemotaxis protein CheX
MEAIHDSGIECVMQGIFSTMLGMEVMRCDAAATANPDTLVANIQISGPQSHIVALALSDGVARAAAAAMLQVDPETVSEADQCDVAGELVNMVGGNFKALLPGPSVLTLPTVAAGQRIGLNVHGAELIEELPMECEAGPLRVRIYAKIAS